MCRSTRTATLVVGRRCRSEALAVSASGAVSVPDDGASGPALLHITGVGAASYLVTVNVEISGSAHASVECRVRGSAGSALADVGGNPMVATGGGGLVHVSFGGVAAVQSGEVDALCVTTATASAFRRSMTLITVDTGAAGPPTRGRTAMGPEPVARRPQAPRRQRVRSW